MPLEELEAECRALGRRLKESLSPEIHFVLILATSGESGFMTYLANARRGDMISMMWEMIQKMENEPEGGPRWKRQQVLEEGIEVLRKIARPWPDWNDDAGVAALRAAVEEAGALIARFDAKP
jgi:hypothetical protein